MLQERLIARRRRYILRATQSAARFSANEARPSEASKLWRLVACIRTSRAPKVATSGR